MLARIICVSRAVLIVFVGIPSFSIGLIIWWNSSSQVEMNVAKSTNASAVILRIVMIFMVMVQTKSVNGKI